MIAQLKQKVKRNVQPALSCKINQLRPSKVGDWFLSCSVRKFTEVYQHVQTITKPTLTGLSLALLPWLE